MPLATMRELARYWATDYDWRKAEAKLNKLPQFVTNIDGLDIHFVHVRSREKNALPLIINHGWPGSVLEQIKLIEPLRPLRRPGAATGVRSSSIRWACRPRRNCSASTPADVDKALQISAPPPSGL
jgi:hypothetical protein